MKLIKLPTITDPRGKLTVIERLPFDIKRVYYIHGVERGAERGGHAHKALDRVLVALHGRVRVTGESGGMTTSVTLDSPEQGVNVPPMTWLVLDKFSAGAICMVLASAEYDAADYIRERAEFDSLSQTR